MNLSYDVNLETNLNARKKNLCLKPCVIKMLLLGVQLLSKNKMLESLILISLDKIK